MTTLPSPRRYRAQRRRHARQHHGGGLQGQDPIKFGHLPHGDLSFARIQMHRTRDVISTIPKNN